MLVSMTSRLVLYPPLHFLVSFPTQPSRPSLSFFPAPLLPLTRLCLHRMPPGALPRPRALGWVENEPSLPAAVSVTPPGCACTMCNRTKSSRSTYWLFPSASSTTTRPCSITLCYGSTSYPWRSAFMSPHRSPETTGTPSLRITFTRMTGEGRKSLYLTCP